MDTSIFLLMEKLEQLLLVIIYDQIIQHRNGWKIKLYNSYNSLNVPLQYN